MEIIQSNKIIWLLWVLVYAPFLNYNDEILYEKPDYNFGEFYVFKFYFNADEFYLKLLINYKKCFYFFI